VRGYFLLAVTAVLLSFSVASEASTSYRIEINSSKEITEFSVAKNVTNKCAYPIFVPTNTASEWSAFVSKAPACVTITGVKTPCEKGGGTALVINGVNVCKFTLPASAQSNGYGNTMYSACYWASAYSGSGVWWNPYQNWSTTGSGSCWPPSNNICRGCTTATHSWANKEIEWCGLGQSSICNSRYCCLDWGLYDDWFACHAHITEVGCTQ